MEPFVRRVRSIPDVNIGVSSSVGVIDILNMPHLWFVTVPGVSLIQDCPRTDGPINTACTRIAHSNHRPNNPTAPHNKNQSNIPDAP